MSRLHMQRKKSSRRQLEQDKVKVSLTKPSQRQTEKTEKISKILVE